VLLMANQRESQLGTLKDLYLALKAETIQKLLEDEGINL
jgi:hypothetical protein